MDPSELRMRHENFRFRRVRGSWIAMIWSKRVVGSAASAMAASAVTRRRREPRNVDDQYLVAEPHSSWQRARWPVMVLRYVRFPGPIWPIGAEFARCPVPIHAPNTRSREQRKFGQADVRSPISTG